MTGGNDVSPAGTEPGTFSLQRSMDICWAISNLSMEWNTKLLMSSFVKIDNQEEYWKDMHEKMAASIVDSIKNLKGCWVKLGQMLSTKPGMLPKCYIDAFCQLQDGMGHSDFAEVIDTLEQEIGYMDDIFKNFDSIPLASASIAQVHKARLFDGQVVAIKVQHKCSEQNLKNDLEILKMLTWVMQKMSKYTKMCQTVEDYAKAAMDELDFNIEANSCKKARVDAARSGIQIFIPRIFDKYSSKRIITMEFFKLYKMTDVEFIKKNNIDAEAIVYDIHDFAMYQILSCGSFHGDPHPGNLQLTKSEVDGKYYPVLLDWGMTQSLTTKQRLGFCRLTASLCMGDTIGCVTGFQQAGFNLMKQKVFSYERFLESLLNIFSSDFNKVMDVCSEESTATPAENIIKKDKWHYQGNVFMKEFITNAPNFFPLLLKMLTEYRNYAIILNCNVPFLQLLYKNTSHALYNAFYSPVFPYLVSHTDKALLLRKTKRIKHRLSADCIDVTEEQILGKVLADAKESSSSVVDMTAAVKFRKPINYLESKISSLLKYISKDNSLIVAAQVAVMRDGKVEADIAHGIMGRYDCRPVNSSVLFQLGSMMMGFIATAVMNLATHEKLNLDDTIAKHWPEFGRNGKDTITIRDMLNQSSGIVTPYPRILLMENMNYETMVMDMEKAHLFKEFAGQTCYAYIFYGWIMAELIRRVSGKPMEEFVLEMAHGVQVPMKQLIFPSVSMNNENEPGNVNDNGGYISEDSEASGDQGVSEKQFMMEIPLSDVDARPEECISGDVTPTLQVTTMVSMESVKTKLLKPKPPGSCTTESNSQEEFMNANVTPMSTSFEKPKGEGNFRDIPVDREVLPVLFDKNNKPTQENNSMVINGRNIYFDMEAVNQPGNMNSLSRMSSLPNKEEVPAVEKINRESSSENIFASKSSSFCVELSSPQREPAKEVQPKAEIKELVMCLDDFLKLPCKDEPPKTVEEFHLSKQKVPRKFTERYLKGLPRKVTPEKEVITTKCSCTTVSQEENSHRRCLCPSEDCPTENRFVRSHRQPLISLDNVDFTKSASTLIPEISKGTNGVYDPVVVSEDDTVVFDKELASLGLPPMYKKVTRTRLRKFLMKNTLPKERVVHHTNHEVISYGCIIVDPISLEYPITYKNSIPFMNGRASAMAITSFYNAALEGKLFNLSMLQEAMHTVVVDRTPLTKILTAFHTPAWGLGFQRFYLKRRSDGEIFLGLGSTDVSGSLYLMVPDLKLVVTLLFSNLQAVAVSHEVFRLVVNHYGLDIINSNLHTGNSTLLYRLLATIKI